ncbi:MAG: FAD:protein FMN transferase, partial [Actinomycetota bacterium]
MTASRDECRFSLPAMGSTVEIVLFDAPPGSAAWVRSRLSALERAWSRFDPQSELVALNRRAGGAPVPASDLLRNAVDASLQLWRATDGWFDPTTLRALEWAGYDRSFTEVRSRSGSAARAGIPPATPTPLGGIVDDDRGTITVPVGVSLDLGGVGKGLAADLLAAELMDRGSSGVLVSVGGDIAVAGTGPDGGWHIPVVDPTDEHRVRWVVPIESGAIVQSNRLVRQWRAGGERCHHLIDPSTSRP